MMTRPFGPEESDALDAALLDLAKTGKTASYAELAERLRLQAPHRIHRLTLALEARITLDHQAGRPLLAAMAVGKFGTPGRGFFQLLRALGRYDGPDSGTEAASHHAKERVAAEAYWRGQRP